MKEPFTALSTIGTLVVSTGYFAADYTSFWGAKIG